MSQENVEVVRRMLQAFADGGLDAMAEFSDPDIDWRAAEGALDDVGEMHGRVAMRRYIQDWIDTFDDSASSRRSRGMSGMTASSRSSD
jgi:ketosteroid isomerase-like protein